MRVCVCVSLAAPREEPLLFIIFVLPDFARPLMCQGVGQLTIAPPYSKYISSH